MHSFQCQKCGYCCKNITINVSYSDIMRWLQEKRYDILDKISYLDNEEVGKGFYIEETLRKKDRKNLPCPFLEKNLCSIYETRPRACADFPDGHSTWKECPAWRKIGFGYDEIKDAKVKRSQREDFAFAWEKRFLLLHFLTLARARDKKAIESLLDPLDPDETLWVTTYDATSQWETTSGSSPWLDDSESYIESATKKADSRNYGFANTAQSANTLTGVSLYMQGQDATGTISEAFLYDGTDWSSVFSLDFDATLGYKSVDVFSWINTWAKVDACQLWFRHENDQVTTRAYRAYLFCTYTVEGLSQQCDETIAVSDSEEKKMNTYYSESPSITEVYLAKGFYKVRDTTLTLFSLPFNKIGLFKTDTLSATSDLFKSIKPLREETFTAVEYLAKAMTRPLVEALALFSDVSYFTTLILERLQTMDIEHYLKYVSNWYYTLPENLTFLDYRSMFLSIFKDLVLTLTHYWSYVKGTFFTESIYNGISLLDSRFGLIGKVREEAISIADFFNLKAFLSKFATISVGEYLDYITTWKRFPSQLLDITDYWSYQITGQLFKTLEQAVNLSSYLFYLSTWNRVYLQTSSLLDYLGKLYAKYPLMETLTLVSFLDTLLAEWLTTLRFEAIGLVSFFFKSPRLLKLDTINIQELIGLSFWKVIYQSISMPYFLNYISSWKRYPLETFNLIADWSYQITGFLFKTLDQAISLSSFISYLSDWKRFPSTVLDIQDFRSHIWAQFLEQIITQPLSLVHYLLTQVQYKRRAPEALSITDFLASFIAKLFSLSFNIVDSMFKKIGPSLQQALTIGDNLISSKQFHRALLEPVAFYDYLITNFFPAIKEIVTRFIRLKFIEA